MSAVEGLPEDLVLAEETGEARHARDGQRADDDVQNVIGRWALSPPIRETQVIANARRHGADRVVLDDLEARRGAKAMGLKVVGTLASWRAAKRAGRIQL